MLFYSNIYLTIFFSLTLIFLNLLIFKKISLLNNQEIIIPKIIFCNHLIFSIIFLLNDILSLFQISPGSDSLSFYFNSNQKILFENIGMYPGHNMMYFISFLLNKIYLDFIASNFVFGILGSLSILIFYVSISDFLRTNFEKGIIIIFILLPSYNFWTSGISKDVITIFSFSILLYSFVKNNLKLLVISIIILFSVRVHLALIALISFLVTIFLSFFYSIIFNKKLYFFNREFKMKYILIIAISFSILILGISKFFYFENIININSTIDHFQNMYPGKNYIESSFLIFRTFEYLFRPYIWENTNIYIKILSVENILLLAIIILLSLNIFNQKLTKIKIHKIDIKLFILLTFILVAIFQIVMTSNTGIAMRQKWTFLPGIIFILIFVKYYFTLEKSK